MLNAFFLKSKLLRMSGILLVILSFCIPAFSASLEALGIEQKKVTVNGVVLDDTREPLIGVSVLVKGSQQGTHQMVLLQIWMENIPSLLRQTVFWYSHL